MPQRRIGEWWLELYTRNPAADANVEANTDGQLGSSIKMETVV